MIHAELASRGGMLGDLASRSCGVCDLTDGELSRHSTDLYIHLGCAPERWKRDIEAQDRFMDRVRAWALRGGAVVS